MALSLNNFYFAFILLFLFSQQCLSQSCDDTVLTVGKRKFDISSIKGKNFEVDHGSYTYKLSVCGKVSDFCGDCREYSGCQEKGWYEYCLGVTSSSDKFELLKGGKGLAIINSGGDIIGKDCWGQNGRKLKFEILCDKSKTGLPTSVEVIEPVCDPLTYEYTIRFSHIAGCSTGGGGLSGGSILLIIIFVTLAVYLIFGAIINIAVRHKSGVEIIPNSSFWGGLPSLIKDGMFFICGRRPGYQTME